MYQFILHKIDAQMPSPAPEGGDGRLVCAAQVVQHAQRSVHVRVAGSRPRRRLEQTHLGSRARSC